MRALVLMVVTGLCAGCGSHDCTLFDPGGATPHFSGTYNCNQKAAIEQCEGISICQGPTSIKVGYDANWKLYFGKTDCNGTYYEMEAATMCAPKPDYPNRYLVTGRQTVSEDPTQQVFYTLSATLDDDASGTPKLTGSLTLNIVPKGGGSGACTTTGNITGECVDCPPKK